MKIEKAFALPEHEPVVPDKLAELVTSYLPGTTKIHILVYAKGGWSKANGILVEDGDDPSGVYSMVKACADHHCEDCGHGHPLALGSRCVRAHLSQVSARGPARGVSTEV